MYYAVQICAATRMATMQQQTADYKWNGADLVGKGAYGRAYKVIFFLMWKKVKKMHNFHMEKSVKKYSKNILLFSIFHIKKEMKWLLVNKWL